MRPKGSGFLEWLFTRNTQQFRDKYGLPPVSSVPSQKTSSDQINRPIHTRQSDADDQTGPFSWLMLSSLFGGATTAVSDDVDLPPQDQPSQSDPPSFDPL